MAKPRGRNLTTASVTPERSVTHRCYECGGENTVSARAMTVPCKHCGKRLRLEDVAVTSYESRRDVATAGVVVVEKKGELIADTVRCNGIIARGKIKAKKAVTSGGPVLVGPDAAVLGDVTAPSLACGPGATFAGQHTIGDVDQLPWRRDQDWRPVPDDS